MTAIERLEELLNQKEEEIQKLRERADEAERDQAWTTHRTYENPKDAPNPDLPVPRLELRWQACEDDRYTIEAVYSLVYRHLLGHIVFVPLGSTQSTGALSRQVMESGEILLPFRDGAHFNSDRKQLKLPAFAICGNVVQEFGPSGITVGEFRAFGTHFLAVRH